MSGLVVDLFAGGGGASVGLEAALGRPVDIAINHDAVALAVHKANHPETRHLEADIWEVRPEDAVGGRPVDVLWASPDCTHFSVAKGGKPRAQGIRSLAWVVVRWAKAVRPRLIFVENVAEFRGWGPLDADGHPIRVKKGETFARWKRQLERLGYAIDYRVLDASDYGAPTRRRRLFLVARRDGAPIAWPEATHGDPSLFSDRRPYRTAAECIDWSIPCPSIFERKRPLAEKTLWRIAEGLRRFVLENPQPFIVNVNHGLVTPTLVQSGYGEREGQAARVPGLDKPLGTIVAGGQKHALVAAFLAKHYGYRGQRPGLDAREPVSTITATDHHALTAATLVKLRGENHGAALDAPMPTVTAGGNHLAEVRAFLVAYYGQGVGQSLTDPTRTITTKDRLGLVTVAGTDYQIIDIGMRMLEPHELLVAQFGRFAASYDLSAARTKTAKVRLIGNSVCPECAEAVVRANLPARGMEVAA